MILNICPNCNTKNENKTKFCGECGTKLLVEEEKCLSEEPVEESVCDANDYDISSHHSLRSYSGKALRIQIPDTVTEINANAFKYQMVESVVIPNSVTRIGAGAFYGCAYLKEITIPFVGADGGMYVNKHFGYIFGANSYSDNLDYVPSSLKEVIITGGGWIHQRAFYDCTELTSITIPSSVKSIGNDAFAGCKSLTSIAIPSGVTSIGERAFKGCTHLTSVTIPHGVKIIEQNLFEGCSSLTSVTIPGSVTRIRAKAFFGCGSLTSINFQGPKKQWEDLMKVAKWDADCGNYIIHCTDGDIK